MTDTHPAVLIEDWLPIEALGVESQRERGSMSALPPTYYLHVWWARRPLIVSRAAILAGTLPQWASNWPKHLLACFPTEDDYHAWATRLIGILGDPVTGRKALENAKALGISIRNPYDSPRAFKVNPTAEDLHLLGDLLEFLWGTREVNVMDVTAGGGSIPFEALRCGFTTYANELNPVASVILKATLDFPIRYDKSLAGMIKEWGHIWYERAKKRLQPYFTPLPSTADGAAYLWARTVACPVTGKPVPLSPNWWIRTGTNQIAVQILADPSMEAPTFILKQGDEIDFDPDVGTVSGGVGISPWTGEVISGDYIKAEAQAGRMGQTLYAVAIKESSGFVFRAPTEEDLAAVSRAEAALHEKLPTWEASGLLPYEEIPVGNKTDEPRRYGMFRWIDMFNPRQLMSILTFVETLREISSELHEKVENDQAIAVQTYLAIMLDKAVIYNNRCSRFDPSRGIRSVFDRHDFAFVWSYGEFDAVGNLLPWTNEQVAKAYRELSELAASAQYPLWVEQGKAPIERLLIIQGSAAQLDTILSSSIQNITFDPPYEANVMYAELSDFFYVWLKRSIGELYPEFFHDHLTNKDDEAVANEARFAGMGRSKKSLALQDYQRKMEAIFRECHRVLCDDGVLTIMFTHKKVEAWDTLAAALINAGFAVEASWPVHTESEHSLHQAKKNAAASTILLVCRKRSADYEPVWWDDIKGRVRQAARQKAEEFAAQGVSGVDLYISTFGPALSVISSQWPVLTSDVDPDTGSPLPLRPETALDLAREEVISLRKQGLLLGRDIDFDAITDWYLMAWDAFKAVEFPYDEARKLAIALGVDLDKDIRDAKKLVARKSSSVVLQSPTQRRKKNMVDPDADTFTVWIDAAHTALMVLAEDGTRACEAFLKKNNYLSDETFKRLVQAMIYAIPRTRIKGKWVRPEAELLERLRLNFYPDIEAPAEPEPIKVPQQKGLWDSEEENVSDEDEEFEDEDDEA